MYTERELIRLAAHKQALRQRIARRRTECAVAIVGVGQPLMWLDRMLSAWHRFSPLMRVAAVPLGFLLKRSARPRPRLLGRLLRWSPVILGAFRVLSAAVTRRPTPDRPGARQRGAA